MRVCIETSGGDLKLKKHVTTTLLIAVLSLSQVIPAMAFGRSAYSLEKTYDVLCAKVIGQNRNYIGALQDGADYSNGIYVMDTLGNKLLANAEDTVYANGLAKDGLLYDAEGRQLNTLEYIKNKYYSKFEAASDETYITFENEKEMRIFMYLYEIECATSQGISYTYKQYSNNENVSIKKSEFSKFQTELGETYQKAVAEDAAAMDMTKPFTERIMQAVMLTTAHFTYDLSGQNFTMEEALVNKKGVCYHYAKYLNGLLTTIGVETKYEIGTLGLSDAGYLHVWNTAKDPDTGITYYLDPSSTRTTEAIIKSPIIYLSNYTQIGITGSWDKIFNK